MSETQKAQWHGGLVAHMKKGWAQSKSSFANKPKFHLSEHIVSTHYVWVFAGNKAGLEI